MKTKKEIEKKGYTVSFTNGTGAGGQKRNRTYSVAVVKHISSGIEKRCDETRNTNKNMNIAFNSIEKELQNLADSEIEERINEFRKQAVEKGTIRTYDFKQGLVKNHITGKKATLKKVLNGNIDLINS